MLINPGELDRKITIYTDDEFTVIRKPWAKVTHISGRELIKEGIETSEATTRFLVRYSKKEVKVGMKILYKNHWYDITYINNYKESNEYLELLTVSRGWDTNENRF